MINFIEIIIAWGTAPSTGNGRLSGFFQSGGGLIGSFQLRIKGGKKVPAGAVVGLQLGGPLGKWHGLLELIGAGFGGGQVEPGPCIRR